MKVLLYGEKSECADAIRILSSLDICKIKGHKVTEDFDEFYVESVDYKPDVFIILKKGAKGMEGAYRAKEVNPDGVVLWFSDDEAFGVQSYRLECSYFALKPVTAEKYIHAFGRLKKLHIM